MRIMLGLTMLAATVALAGCKSDAAQMEEARKVVGDMCRQNPLPGVDMNRYCTCIVDKSINTKTASELRSLDEKKAQELGTKAATECLGQEGVAAPQMGGAAAPAAPAEQAGEAVEEGADEAN
jgi:hypothetical protein